MPDLPSDQPVTAGGRPLTIHDVVEKRLMRLVFQPLYDIQERRVFAYEALVRGTTQTFPGPAEILKGAVEADLIGDLGRILREMAIEGCPDTPLFLNIHPGELNHGLLVRPDDPIYFHDQPIFIEITESVPLTHFRWCNEVLTEMRSRDIMLAVDDLGSGYSNLKYIADLQPEVVKLDMALIRDLDTTPRKMILVKAIVRLCVDLGARVVAEGIETLGEYQAVVDTGAHLAQGYFLARPAFPPPEVDEATLGIPKA
ncbi:MAG: EAL domain-containing protein [Deltaproteobacteria bacterium]|nr:EAL domain-containing protein [Deltaproteobacteria bacterium]